MKNKEVYLDYAATTPVDPKVLQEMLLYFKEEFGNPSSIHNLGQKSQEAIDSAREKVSRFLNCSSTEIVFTGSATEANNLAIFGIIKNYLKKGNKPHIITTKIEHHAVFEPCEELEKQGVEVTYLDVDKDGLIKVSDIKKAIKENTVLVSVMYANNEIGIIQPIAEIADVIRNFRSPKSQYPIFHTDAVQAANYLDCDVKKLGVDLLTLSGHKIYGPKGIGVLYVKQGISIKSLIYGGGQEEGLRSGTENVPAIIGMGKAVEEIGKNKSEIKKIKDLRDKLIKEILEKVPNSKLNGSREERLPNNVNISIPGAEGESLVIALDQEGIAISTGSACSSKDLKPSHVLLAIGLPAKEAHGSLRITLGKYTIEKEINKIIKVLPKIVERIRKISPFKQ